MHYDTETSVGMGENILQKNRIRIFHNRRTFCIWRDLESSIQHMLKTIKNIRQYHFSWNVNSFIRVYQCEKYKIWFVVLQTNYVGVSERSPSLRHAQHGRRALHAEQKKSNNLRLRESFHIFLLSYDLLFNEALYSMIKKKKFSGEFIIIFICLNKLFMPSSNYVYCTNKKC